MTFHRYMTFFAFVAVAALMIPASALAQSGTGTATAEILQTIKVAAVADLDFGQIVPKQVDGAVTVSPGGAVSSTQAFVITPGSPATWNVTGLAGEGYQVSLPGTETLVRSDGRFSMWVNGFQHNAGSTPTLDASGTASFNVGATLEVKPNQPVGSYSGTYTVSVAYN